jgi:hypothetical protein
VYHANWNQNLEQKRAQMRAINVWFLASDDVTPAQISQLTPTLEGICTIPPDH